MPKKRPICGVSTTGTCCTRTKTPTWTQKGWPDWSPELDAHIDGLRIAGAGGIEIAQERLADFPEAGELFVLRMLQPEALHLTVCDLDLVAVRAYLAQTLDLSD